MVERDESVIEEFRRRRTRQLVVIVPVVAVLVFMTTRGEGESIALAGLPEAVVGVTALVIILAVLAFSISNWRCPSCNRYLGKAINPAFCSRCGAQLR